jgi:hypothetical protein
MGETRPADSSKTTGPIVSLLCAYGDGIGAAWSCQNQAGERHENFALSISILSLVLSKSTNWLPLIPTISISEMAALYALQKYSTDMYLGSAKVPIVDDELRSSN